MHTKKHSRKTRGKKHRGGYYGASGPIPGAGGAPAGMRWGSAQEVATPTYAKGGRRRKSMKGKKTMKKRLMKGGNRFGAVSASFQGKGIGGMANYTGINTKTGPSSLGAWNDNGAKPGSPFP